MFWFPVYYPPVEPEAENVYIVQGKKTPVKCAGCGQFMKQDNLSYVSIMTMRCHMRERCIYNTYLKAKDQMPSGELALFTEGDYGKP